MVVVGRRNIRNLVCIQTILCLPGNPLIRLPHRKMGMRQSVDTSRSTNPQEIVILVGMVHVEVGGRRNSTWQLGNVKILERQTSNVTSSVLILRRIYVMLGIGRKHG